MHVSRLGRRWPRTFQVEGTLNLTAGGVTTLLYTVPNNRKARLIRGQFQYTQTPPDDASLLLSAVQGGSSGTQYADWRNTFINGGAEPRIIVQPVGGLLLIPQTTLYATVADGSGTDNVVYSITLEELPA